MLSVSNLLQSLTTTDTFAERLSLVDTFKADESSLAQLTRHDAKLLAEAWCSFPRLIPLIDLSVYACRMRDPDFLVVIKRIVNDRLLNISASPNGQAVLDNLRAQAEYHGSAFLLRILSQFLKPTPEHVLRMMQIHFGNGEYTQTYEIGENFKYHRNPALFQLATRQLLYARNRNEELISTRLENMISIWKNEFEDLPDIDLSSRKEGRIRIGYFDAIYNDTNYCEVFRPIPKLHNTSRFDVYHLAIDGYENDTEERSSAIEWIDLKELDPRQKIQKIRMLDLDIIFDTWGIVYRDDAKILSAGLAKAQVHGAFNSFASTNTLYSHILAPRNYLNEETRAQIDETIIDLDAPHFPLDVRRRRSVEVHPAPHKKNGYVTFGSLSNSYKISKDSLHLWGKIVGSIENAHFFLGTQFAGNLSQKSTMYAIFGQYGIEPSRITIARASGFPDYLRALEHIDICLATYPNGGAMTVSDYLVHGRPCLVLDAPGILGRMGRIALQGLGLSELAFQTEQDIISAAQRLANDTSLLDKLCAEKLSLDVLIKKSDETALQYTRALEQAYEKIFADFIEPKITKEL